MIGGPKHTGYLAAVAAFCAMGPGVFLHQHAKAADLGGDCCADLEDRVAELEATTVRKGNKKVSVQIYGKVNYANLTWNDGAETNNYTVNNYMESTRWGFKGSAKIGGDWSAGYRLEVEVRPAASSRLNQFDDNNAFDPNGALNVRWSTMYLSNKTWGELRWGLTATPKYDITKDAMEYISTEPGEGGGLSDTLVPDFRMNDSFRLRQSGFDNAEGLSSLAWQNIARCYSANDQFNCSTRRNGVAYWSPTWEGFSTQWGVYEDDMWGGAVRYRGSFAPFGGAAGLSKDDPWLFAASAAYEKITDERLLQGAGGGAGFERDFDEWAGSAALKHKPTGLFIMGAWSISDSSDSNVKGIFNGEGAPQMTAWDVQGGIQRKLHWFGLDRLGDTAFWGGFSDVNGGFAPGSNPNSTQICQPACQVGSLGVRANMLLPAGTFPGIPFNTQITDSDVNTWFLAFDQQLEAASMHIYAVFEHFEPDVDLIDSSRNRVPLSIDDFNLGYVGGRLYF
jgi:predicted porin